MPNWLSPFKPYWLLVGSVATLQECFDKLGRYGPRTLSRRSVQMAPIRTGNDTTGSGLVLAFFTVVPRRRGTPCRARTFGRPRHRLEMGAALRPRNSAPIATAAPTDQRQLAGG